MQCQCRASPHAWMAGVARLLPGALGVGLTMLPIGSILQGASGAAEDERPPTIVCTATEFVAEIEGRADRLGVTLDCTPQGFVRVNTMSRTGAVSRCALGDVGGLGCVAVAPILSMISRTPRSHEKRLLGGRRRWRRKSSQMSRKSSSAAQSVGPTHCPIIRAVGQLRSCLATVGHSGSTSGKVMAAGRRWAGSRDRSGVEGCISTESRFSYRSRFVVESYVLISRVCLIRHWELVAEILRLTNCISPRKCIRSKRVLLGCLPEGSNSIAGMCSTRTPQQSKQMLSDIYVIRQMGYLFGQIDIHRKVSRWGHLSRQLEITRRTTIQVSRCIVV